MCGGEGLIVMGRADGYPGHVAPICLEERAMFQGRAWRRVLARACWRRLACVAVGVGRFDGR